MDGWFLVLSACQRGRLAHGTLPELCAGGCTLYAGLIRGHNSRAVGERGEWHSVLDATIRYYPPAAQRPVLCFPCFHSLELFAKKKSVFLTSSPDSVERYRGRGLGRTQPFRHLRSHTRQPRRSSSKSGDSGFTSSPPLTVKDRGVAIQEEEIISGSDRRVLGYFDLCAPPTAVSQLHTQNFRHAYINIRCRRRRGARIRTHNHHISGMEG